MPSGLTTFRDVRAAAQASAMQRWIYDEFRTPILCMDGPGDLTVPETTGPNVFITGSGNVFEYEGVGTLDAATILWSSTLGLDLGAVMTSNNVGVSIHPAVSAGKTGLTGIRTKGSFVNGTDPAFYFSLTFMIPDVSGTDVCAAGFRKVEATQVNADTLETYTDIAVLDALSGDIKIKTILNNGTTTTTDTTQNWADGETHTFTVVVDSLGALGGQPGSGVPGAVYFAIDGAPPTVTASFTFDSGDTLIPFFTCQNDSDVAADGTSGIVLTKWESGLYGVGSGISIDAFPNF